MANMYLFRGVSATGKTTITSQLGRIYRMPVLRKDDIYDSIRMDLTHSEKTAVSYDALAKMIQTNLDLGNDILVDIALPHQPYAVEFLSKIDWHGHQLIPFFCICSNTAEWKRRWAERMENPAPNQLFIRLDQIDAYYQKFDFTLLEGERVIDSAEGIPSILQGLKQYFEA